MDLTELDDTQRTTLKQVTIRQLTIKKCLLIKCSANIIWKFDQYKINKNAVRGTLAIHKCVNVLESWRFEGYFGLQADGQNSKIVVYNIY
jgi:hypothetical protein